MTNTRTPGDWYASPITGTRILSSVADGPALLIADVCTDRLEWVHNARLLEAAPLLQRSARTLCNALRAEGYADSYGALDELLELLQAVEGEAP